MARACKPLAVRLAWATSGSVRHATGANARRLRGAQVSRRETRRYARGVIGRFYDAVLEIGTARATSPHTHAIQPESVEGREPYREARQAGRGAVLVTAHVGSFESAIGTLRTIENHVHVVFQRDEHELFETLRSRQRSRLGVREAPVDDGLATWMSLRDALERDEVVLMQGDRCMPGQRGVEVPFLGGHLRVPTGPARLARLTGSPVIPVFAIGEPGGGYRVVLTDPIVPGDHPHHSNQPDPIIPIIAERIEHVVREHPEQWLCLHPVLVEDRHDSEVS